MNASLNEKLKAVRWGEFKLTDVFNVRNTSNVLARNIVENSGTVPYLCAGSENNAVSTYIDYDEKYVEKGNCIFIGGKTLVVTYQQKDFYSNDSHNLALYLKEGTKSKAVFLYMVSCVYKNLCRKYSWGNSISKAKIQNDIITLPTTNDGRIDFDFMESFIAELEAERMAELEQYLAVTVAVTGLDNYELTDEDREVLERFKTAKPDSSAIAAAGTSGMSKIDTSAWKEFRVGDLFTLKSPKKRFNANAIELHDKRINGSHPYVVRTSENNGRRGYIVQDEQYLSPASTFSFGQDTATIFFQAESYFTGDKIKVMSLADETQTLDDRIACFLRTQLRSAFSLFQWGRSSFNEQVLRDTKVLLPVSEENEPDYDFMEKYIRAVEKLVIKEVVIYTNRKIEKTKEAIQNGKG